MRIKLLNDLFFRILGYNSLSVVFKVLMGVISSKLVSIYLGVQGINTLEYFRNFISISDSLSQIGIQNGVVKHIATCQSKNQEKRIISTAFFMILLMMVFVFSVLLIGLNYFQSFLFGNNQYENILLLYIFSLPLVVFQNIFLSILQGKQKFKKVIFINIIGYILNIILSIVLIIRFQLEGAMYQIVLAPIALSIISLGIIQRQNNFLANISITYLDKAIARSLLQFSFMSLLSSILTPLSFILIRNLIQTNLGSETSGIWSSIIRLSSFYMLFVSSICSLYFFPKLAKAHFFKEKKAIVSEYFIKFVPLVFIGLLVCYFSQNFIILFLYTTDFLIITKYFYLQLIADFIKTLSLIYGYFLIAKQDLKKYMIFEIISVGVYYAGALFLIDNMGLNGVFYALIFSLIIYFGLVWRSFVQFVE